MLNIADHSSLPKLILVDLVLLFEEVTFWSLNRDRLFMPKHENIMIVLEKVVNIFE